MKSNIRKSIISDDWEATCFWNYPPDDIHFVKEQTEDELVIGVGKYIEIRCPIDKEELERWL